MYNNKDYNDDQKLTHSYDLCMPEIDGKQMDLEVNCKPSFTLN